MTQGNPGTRTGYPLSGTSEKLLVRKTTWINCTVDRHELEGIGTPKSPQLPLCLADEIGARMVSQSRRLSEDQRSAHSRLPRSGVVKGGRLWGSACVVALLVTISDIAASGPSGPQVPADRHIQLVGNCEKGASLFQNRCSMCHAPQEGGPDNLGPTLHGLFGRQAGPLPKFNYSPDLRNSRIVWNAQTLDEYLVSRTGADRETRCRTPVYPARPTATISSLTLSKRRDKGSLGGCGRGRHGLTSETPH